LSIKYLKLASYDEGAHLILAWPAVLGRIVTINLLATKTNIVALAHSTFALLKVCSASLTRSKFSVSPVPEKLFGS
jgi:hypothetical protein